MNEPLAGSSGTDAQLLRMEHQLTEINARIARLAMALGVSLENEHEVQAALTTLQPPPIDVDRRKTPDRRGGSRSGQDRRKGATRMELRGLLVLRYGTQRRFVEQVGPESARRLMQVVEQHMEQRGFDPGADGVHIDAPPRST